MTDDEPKRVFLGSFDSSSVTALVIPAPVLDRANARFDREREARLKSEAMAKLAIMQNVRGRVRLKKALKMIFGRRGRR